MASSAHCIFCFEVLAAELEGRKSLSFQDVDSLWAEYGVISKPQGNSSNGVPSNGNVASTPTAPIDGEFPIFVTWNIASSSGRGVRLRGCKGTFAAAPLRKQLEDFSLIAALDDNRFRPISRAELPRLSCGVTILHSFTPIDDPLDWKVGHHGIRLDFRDSKGGRYGATYLPDVAEEQGWTQEDAVVSAISKAGFEGGMEAVKDLKVTTYQGWKESIGYNDFQQFRSWLEQKGKLGGV